MVHDSDYNNTKNKYLDLPSFREILTSMDSRSSMSKPNNTNKSFSLMRDLNKKKTYI